MATGSLNVQYSLMMVEELRRHGVTRFVVSPGSRSTPLTLAVSELEGIESRVHFDERGAAWFAYGWAKSCGGPVCLICTSGTATANYMPAIVESAMARVPLIVVTADRPPELLDAGANQAVFQTGLYGGYVRWAATLPCPELSVPPESVLTTVDQGVYRATRSPAGPVHLNAMFREPFVPGAADPPFRESEFMGRWRKTESPYTSYAGPRAELPPESVESVSELLNGAVRGLIIAGQMGGADPEAVAAFADRSQWPVFPDVLSGLRLNGMCQTAIPFYDALLRAPRFRDQFEPDIVVQFGAPVVSKTLMQSLEACAPRHYLLVADHPYRHDPIHRVFMRIESDIAGFCRQLLPRLAPSARPSWAVPWRKASARVARIFRECLVDELNEPGIARQISMLLEPDTALFLGNSMPIRDMDAFGEAKGRCRRVFGNRGASGIDGNVATTAGLAMSGMPVTAVIGDLALLHDVNSLALLRETPGPVTLVVINNQGGGMFSFLPIAEYAEHFERYWAAPHDLNFEHLAYAFGLGYARPGSAQEFAACYRKNSGTRPAMLVEVRTDRRRNLMLHRALHEQALRALA